MGTFITVDGVGITTPSSYNPYPNLREKSSEDGEGNLKRKIKSSRWKLEMSWDYLTNEQYNQLLEIKFKKEFECNFPTSAGRFTKTMYGGDISGNANRADINGVMRDWTEVKFNFIQTKADKYVGGII